MTKMYMIFLSLSIVLGFSPQSYCMKQIYASVVYDARYPGQWENHVVQRLLEEQNYGEAIRYFRYYLRFQPKREALDFIIAEKEKGHVPCFLMHAYSLTLRLRNTIPVSSQEIASVLESVLKSLLFAYVDHATCKEYFGQDNGGFVAPWLKSFYKKWLSWVDLDSASGYQDVLAKVAAWFEAFDLSQAALPTWVSECNPQAKEYRDLFGSHRHWDSDARLARCKENKEAVNGIRRKHIEHYLGLFKCSATDTSVASWQEFFNAEDYELVGLEEGREQTSVWQSTMNKVETVQRLTTCGSLLATVAGFLNRT